MFLLIYFDFLYIYIYNKNARVNIKTTGEKKKKGNKQANKEKKKNEYSSFFFICQWTTIFLKRLFTPYTGHNSQSTTHHKSIKKNPTISSSLLSPTEIRASSIFIFNLYSLLWPLPLTTKRIPHFHQGSPAHFRTPSLSLSLSLSLSMQCYFTCLKGIILFNLYYIYIYRYKNKFKIKYIILFYIFIYSAICLL